MKYGVTSTFVDVLSGYVWGTRNQVETEVHSFPSIPSGMGGRRVPVDPSVSLRCTLRDLNVSRITLGLTTSVFLYIVKFPSPSAILTFTGSLRNT